MNDQSNLGRRELGPEQGKLTEPDTPAPKPVIHTQSEVDAVWGYISGQREAPDFGLPEEKTD